MKFKVVKVFIFEIFLKICAYLGYLKMCELQMFQNSNAKRNNTGRIKFEKYVEWNNI